MKCNNFQIRVAEESCNYEVSTLTRARFSQHTYVISTYTFNILRVLTPVLLKKSQLYLFRFVSINKFVFCIRRSPVENQQKSMQNRIYIYIKYTYE